MRMRKNPSQKEIKTIEQEAKRVRDEYDYMDEMPLEGWMWEFIRRTKTYREVLDYIQGQKGCDDIPSCVVALFKECRFPPGVDQIASETCFIHETELSKALNDNHYEITAQPRKENLLLTFHRGLPKPSVRYCDFEDNQKPRVAGLVPVSYMNYSDLEKHLSQMSHEITEHLFSIYEEGKSTNDFFPDTIQEAFFEYLKTVLKLIAPTRTEDTIFIGISTKAKKTVVINEIHKTMDTYVEQVNEINRDSSWKYYLIAYDLVYIEKYTLSKTSEIFQKAFTRIPRKKGGHRNVFYTEDDIKRLRNRARDYIEDDEYRKFLRPVVASFAPYAVKHEKGKTPLITISEAMIQDFIRVRFNKP